VFDSSADAEYLTQIEVLSGVLGYSSTYYWHVRYQDNHGDWSEWSAETSFTTAAEPQADFWASSVGSSEGFIVVFFTNTSSGGVSPLTCAWDFDNDGTIDSTDWQPWYCYRQPGTYTVNLSVMDASGDADTEVKVNCLAVLSSDGATVETADGQISTEFAAGAVPGVAMVTIKETSASGLSEVPRTFMMGDTCFVISALDDSGNEIVTLSQPSTITVRYSGADVAAAGGDPNSLVLAYWDEAAGQWKTLKTSVDTANLTLSASTAHLCTWAVLAKTTSASDGLPLWLWAVIGLVVVMAAGSGTYLVARRTARSMAGSPAEGA